MENLRKLINGKIKCLVNSNETFEDIFNIIHNQNDKIFCEIISGYKIKKTTYGECKDLSIAMGHYFQKRLKDLSKGSFVGLMMENSLQWITSFWGLLMAGYKPMLINIRLGTKLNEDIKRLLGLKYIVCDKKYGLVDEEIVINEIDIFDKYNEEFNWENQLALSTSATSLNIKICIYNGNDIVEQIKNSKSIVKENNMIKCHYKKSLKLLAFLPFYHIFGLVATYFWFSFFGRTFVFLNDCSSETILKTVRKHEVTHIFAVPLLWNGIYKEIIKQVNMLDDKTKNKFNKGIKLSLFVQNIFPKLGRFIASNIFKDVQKRIFGKSIRFLITGGGYISSNVLKMINAIGYPLFNGYGMSEIGITSVELRKKVKYRILGLIGKPFKSVNYQISDNKLFVRGKSICSYVLTKDGLNEIDHNSWFDTKDISKVDNKGYYYIEGREDDIVISSNGEKINPDLLEKSIFLPSAKRFSILGLEAIDNFGNNSLSLIIEIDDKTNKLKLQRIIHEVEENLNVLEKLNYHIEKIYVTNDNIASDSAIKVSRTILLNWIKNGNVKLSLFSELINNEINNDDEIVIDVCKDIKEIMAEILGKNIEDIDLNSHFIFDLGGTSIEYITLLIKLKEKYEIEFNYSDYCYTVYQFSNYIINYRK